MPDLESGAVWRGGDEQEAQLLTSAYFVLDGVAHAAEGDVPPIVLECARRLRSRFYSVDVIQRSDGQLRIVEVGDGQVSDLVGWTAAAFATRLAEHFGRRS